MPPLSPALYTAHVQRAFVPSPQLLQTAHAGLPAASWQGGVRGYFPRNLLTTHCVPLTVQKHHFSLNSKNLTLVTKAAGKARVKGTCSAATPQGIRDPAAPSLCVAAALHELHPANPQAGRSTGSRMLRSHGAITYTEQLACLSLRPLEPKEPSKFKGHKKACLNP